MRGGGENPIRGRSIRQDGLVSRCSGQATGHERADALPGPPEHPLQVGRPHSQRPVSGKPFGISEHYPGTRVAPAIRLGGSMIPWQRA